MEKNNITNSLTLTSGRYVFRDGSIMAIWLFPSVFRNVFLILSALFLGRYISALPLNESETAFTSFPTNFYFWTTLILFMCYLVFSLLDWKGIGGDAIMLFMVLGGFLPFLIYLWGFQNVLFKTPITEQSSMGLMTSCYIVFAIMTALNMLFIVRYYYVMQKELNSKSNMSSKDKDTDKENKSKQKLAQDNAEMLSIGYVIANMLLSLAILLVFILTTIEVSQVLY